MTIISKQMLKQEIDRLDTQYLELVYKILQQFPHEQTVEKVLLSGSVSHYVDPIEPVDTQEVTPSNLEVSTTNEVMSHFQVSLERNYRLGELLAK